MSVFFLQDLLVDILVIFGNNVMNTCKSMLIPGDITTITELREHPGCCIMWSNMGCHGVVLSPFLVAMQTD
jgi:hypothetical protein